MFDFEFEWRGSKVNALVALFVIVGAVTAIACAVISVGLCVVFVYEIAVLRDTAFVAGRTYAEWSVLAGLALFLAAWPAYWLWRVLAWLRDRRTHARCVQAGMDGELADHIVRALDARGVDAALAHWQNPNTVRRWETKGDFHLDRDGAFLWCRKLSDTERARYGHA